MLAKTHSLFALTVTAFALETADWKVLAVAAIASQLPDVDTSSSLAGRVLLPLARWLENRFPHRTVTHSVLATGAVALLAWPLRWHSVPVWSALVLGYGCGWFGDVFTKSGVAAFYPLSSARLVIPANPRLRLATGSRAEFVVCGALLLAFFWSLHLNTNGGLLRSFNLWLAQPEGVAALFARESTRHQILAHLEGRLVTSARLVKEDVEVLEVEGERLLVRDARGQRFWAGHTQSCPNCHLDIHRVQARLGAPVVIETRELHWQEEELQTVIGGWWPVDGKDAPPTTDHQPPATVFLSGELTLRDADGLRLPTSWQQFNPVEVVGNPDEWTRVRTLRLRAATPADIAPLHRYFGSGHLVVRIIRGGNP